MERALKKKPLDRLASQLLLNKRPRVLESCSQTFWLRTPGLSKIRLPAPFSIDFRRQCFNHFSSINPAGMYAKTIEIA